MTAAGAAPATRDRLGIWCGWVLTGAAVLVPILGWLAPLGFAILVSIVGLLCLPAMRLTDEDRPVAIILFAALIWAAVSTTWSPYHPSKPGNSTILKLALQLPLYWSAISAARRADPALRTRALHVLAWGCAAFGLVLLIETLTQGLLFKTLHPIYKPIRDDIADAKLGHSTFVLALLWPVAAYGAPMTLRPWLAGAMFVGTAAAAIAFGSDAPVLGLILAPLAAVLVWRWPTGAPRIMAGLAAILVLTVPGIVWAVRHYGDYAAIQRAIPLSYSLRMGYWSHAIDWIRQQPLRGWGLDASRMFGPGIKLHPHNDPLQEWMELGAVGAVAAAAFWGVALAKLARPARDLLAGATAGSAAVYLLFAMFNFGVWQEWFLALGALVVVVARMNSASTAAPDLE